MTMTPRRWPREKCRTKRALELVTTIETLAKLARIDVLWLVRDQPWQGGRRIVPRAYRDVQIVEYHANGPIAYGASRCRVANGRILAPADQIIEHALETLVREAMVRYAPLIAAETERQIARTTVA